MPNTGLRGVGQNEPRFVVLALVACAVLGSGCSSTPTPEAAGKALEKRGAKVEWDGWGTSPVRILFPSGEFSRADLALLPRLPKLQNVNFSVAKIEPGGVAEIGKCAKLRWLHFDRTRVTDDDLRSLENLGELRSLLLSGSSRIGVNGFKSISKLTNLEFLSLSDGSYDPNGFKFLSSMARLEGLSLGWSNLSDDSLVGIGQITSLKKLSLVSTNVTDEGLPHLNTLTSLESFAFERTGGITDTGLETLGRLPKLQKIRTNGQLSQEAKERFRMKYPHIKLDFDP